VFERAYVWFSGVNLLVFVVVAFSLLSIACEAGFRFGGRSARHQTNREGVGTISAAMLGLLSFTLGLTIGYAQDRAETRRGLVVHEANAISTAWLRAKLVRSQEGSAIVELIEEFAKVELAFTVAGSAEPEAGLITRREALQDRIWGLEQTIARADPTPVTVTLANAVSEMFDAALAQRFAFDSRVPPTLSWMLLFGALLAVGAMGYQFGLSGARHPLLVSLLLVMWTGGMALIMDLNQPRLGSIRVDPAPLIWTIHSFESPPLPH